MAVTRLSDVVVPEVFTPYMMKRTMEKSAIFNAGLLRQDGNLAAFLSGGGRTENVPFWNDLANDEENIGSDDPTSAATPNKITTGKDICIRHNRNNGWSSARLTSELAGDDPMKRIAERVSDYWMRSFQRHMVSTLRGVFQDNSDNDSGDMINDISTDGAGAITAAELVSAEAIIDTKQTMGDAADALSSLVMHSVVYSRLQKLNLIDFIPDSNGVIRFASYLGYTVVVDDGCPAIAGTNRTRYHTYLLGRDTMGWAEVPPMMPTEIDRDPELGDGQGVDTLWSRRQYVMHPYGIKWTDTTVAGQSPTNAELILAANWDRVYPERKQIPMALLITNG